MAPPKFTDTDLRAYLNAGHTQAEAARHFSVSEAAIHQRLKRMRVLTSQVVALEKGGQVVEEKLSATARLERVQKVIDEELGWTVKHAKSELIVAHWPMSFSS
jgi:transposase